MKDVEDWSQAWYCFKLNMRNMPVLENLVSSTQHRGIVIELCPCPKLQMPDARLVIGIFSDEEHAFFKEGILLKLWPLENG